MPAAERGSGRDSGRDSGATVIAQGSQSRITDAEGARAERALAAYLGPIAKVLVKRELRSAASPAALWERLAEHIDVEAERAVFLRQRDR